MNVGRGKSDRDRIAARAAMLLEEGQAKSINEAIRQAADSLGVIDGPMPSHAAVRKHAQAQAMQSMGEAGYRASRRCILQVAEQVMTVLEHVGCESRLMGRAAAGHLDADVKLHLRVHCDQPVGDLAQTLVDFGYDEPQFDTVQTMYGRLSRILFVEEAIPVVLMACPRVLAIDPNVDVFTGKSIASATIGDVRQQIARQYDS